MGLPLLSASLATLAVPSRKHLPRERGQLKPREVRAGRERPSSCRCYATLCRLGLAEVFWWLVRDWNQAPLLYECVRIEERGRIHERAQGILGLEPLED